MVVDVASSEMSLVEVEGGNDGLQLERPLKYAHTDLVRAAEAPAPVPVPELDPGKDWELLTLLAQENAWKW